MRSSRLLEMVLLLQAKNPRPARELATALEVSERTVFRDVDALSAAGVPIYATRGVRGGICLVEGYRRAISELDEDEIRALYVDGNDPLADLGFGAPLKRAREKLAAGLSERQRHVAEKARARIRIDQRRWGQDEVPTAILSVVRRGVWDDRRLEIAYRDRTGKRTSRRIDPLGLVSKSGIWYVIARSGAEYRSFRADRIVSAELLGERFERPANFDLDAYWSQSTQQYAATIAYFPVTVRVANASLDEITAYWRTASVEPDGDDFSLVRFDFPSRSAAVHQLIAWCDLATVVEPPDVVDDVLGLARTAIARYQPLAPALS